MTQVIKDLHCPKCNSTEIVRIGKEETKHKVRVIEIEGNPELDLYLIDQDVLDDPFYRCEKCQFKSENVSDFGFPRG